MSICCDNGTLFEWNFADKSSKLDILRSDFDKDALPTCIDYSPDGKFLSVATAKKKIHIYEVESKTW